MTVLELLAQSPGLTPAQIAKKLGKDPASIRSYLHRLAKEGVVTRLENGGYILAADVPGGGAEVEEDELLDNGINGIGFTLDDVIDSAVEEAAWGWYCAGMDETPEEFHEWAKARLAKEGMFPLLSSDEAGEAWVSAEEAHAIWLKAGEWGYRQAKTRLKR